MGKYVLVAIVLFLAFMMWRKMRYYKRVFSDEHYFEVAEVLHELKELALKKVGSTYAGPVEGKVTSAGLIISYSIQMEDGQFEHHVALSTKGRRTLHGIAHRFIYYSIWVLGLPIEQLQMAASQTSVHHGKVTISAMEQEEFPGSPKKIPSVDELKANQLKFIENEPECHPIRVDNLES